MATAASAEPLRCKGRSVASLASVFCLKKKKKLPGRAPPEGVPLTGLK